MVRKITIATLCRRARRAVLLVLSFLFGEEASVVSEHAVVSSLSAVTGELKTRMLPGWYTKNFRAALHA